MDHKQADALGLVGSSLLVPAFAALAGLLYYGQPVLLPFVLAVFQIVQGNFVGPKVLGSGLHLHPVTVLLAIGFWGLVCCLVGAFLALPLTAIIRLISLRLDALRPLARLLGGRVPDIEKPSAASTLGPV